MAMRAVWFWNYFWQKKTIFLNFLVLKPKLQKFIRLFFYFCQFSAKCTIIVYQLIWSIFYSMAMSAVWFWHYFCQKLPFFCNLSFTKHNYESISAYFFHFCRFRRFRAKFKIVYPLIYLKYPKKIAITSGRFCHFFLICRFQAKFTIVYPPILLTFHSISPW